MALSNLSFSQVQAILQTAVNAYCGGLVSFAPGQPLSALVNAVAGNALEIEQDILSVLLTTRLATCVGGAVDTWVGDYTPAGFTPRLQATYSTGNVTFGGYAAPVSNVYIQPGANVATFDGSVDFTVVKVTNSSAWSAGANAYVMVAGSNSVSVPVRCLTAGTSGNVQSGTITSISSSLAGIDWCTNPLAFTNATNAESDQSVKNRFWNFFTTRAEATQPAVEYAITSVQQGITYNIVENPVGRDGFFVVYIDDGSGNPPSSLISSVSAAINNVRPIAVTYNVLPCNCILVSVSLAIYVQSGFDPPTVQGNVGSAIAAWINSVGVGNPLYYTDVVTVARNVQGVTHIESVSLNGAEQDIGGGVGDSVHPLSISVNFGS